MTKMKVGDKIRFNDWGPEQCFGTAFGLSHMKTRIYTITNIDADSITEPELTYIVEVDDPELSLLMIDSDCFDKVEA